MDRKLRTICKRIMQVTGHEVGNLRIQKLLYFIQAYTLVKFGCPAFEAEIEAWPYGPVVPEVYFAYKNNYFLDSLEAEIQLDSGVEEAIVTIVNAFRDWKDFQLVDLTHSYETWSNKISSLYNDREITKKEIKDFHYKKNLDGGIF